MHHDVRNHLPRIPFRILHKNVWFLVSLPLVTLVFVLVYSPRLETSNYQNGDLVFAEASGTFKAKDAAAVRKVFQQVPATSNLEIGGELVVANAPRFTKKIATKLKIKEDIEITNLQSSITPDSGIQRTSKNFTIHVWKHGERMKRRFLRSYGNTIKDPYASCSVKNCILSIDDSKVNDSDAVLFHLHQTLGPMSLPSHHPPHQLWMFFTDESPHHTFFATTKYKMGDYDGLFNYSMTYRADSDVPVPYGRTVPLTDSEKRNFRSKNFARLKQKGVAILGSNCGGKNHRWKYVDELQKHIEVDIYGGCGTHKCPGHFMRDCPLISDYKFYLAFENSNCREYITEKLWWNAFGKETVPVVMGAPKSDYQRLCPPKSFIHTGDFANPAELAKYLSFLMRNDTEYNSYFDWKKDFRVANEHGYFGSPSLHLCRICEALNNNVGATKPKTYNDLDAFWNAKTDCQKASWIPPK